MNVLSFWAMRCLTLVLQHICIAWIPEAQEGLLTQRKSKIVSRKNLNLLGEFIDLEILLEVKMRREDIRPTMVGNAMESLIGALYLDFGYVRTNKALINLLKRFGLDEKIHETTDFKSQLHHWAQKQRVTLHTML